MKLGINHQILISDAQYADWWNGVKTWAESIRLDTHMGAYAWRVSPAEVYSTGFTPSSVFVDIARRCQEAGISIQLIREGFPPYSPHWMALGGDWSTLNDGNWRNDVTPKAAWSKINAWTSYMAKQMTTVKGVKLRWQGPNEQFGRGKDHWAYERARNVYTSSSYSREWTSPTFFGPRPQLLEQLSSWEVMRRYDPAFAKAKYLSVNLYADWTPGVTINEHSNLVRILENVHLVAEHAAATNQIVVVSEFGFGDIQVPDLSKRLRYLATVAKYMRIKNFESAHLYWSMVDEYYLSNEALSEFGRLAKEPPTPEELKLYAEIEAGLKQAAVIDAAETDKP
jgi:hypothetical protein